MSKTYGFGGRLSAEFPSQVIIDVTEVCNLACIHCPHPVFKKSEHYSAAYLPLSLVEKAVSEVLRYGASYIRFASEGEPLVHPGIYDMLDYAVQNSGTFVTLTTNGTTMNGKRIKKLLDSGLHMIDVSLDALTPETYARVRVNGNLKVTQTNVHDLLRWSIGTPTKIVISFVSQPENAHEAEGFKRYWTEAGADAVIIRPLHSAAGAVIHVADNMRKRDAALKRRPCVYPWERIVLNPRGHLAFCPADWTHGSTVVDYRDATIKETWDSPFYRRLRIAHMNNEFSCHKFCGQCPDWAATRWPGDGMAYADLIEEMK